MVKGFNDEIKKCKCGSSRFPEYPCHDFIRMNLSLMGKVVNSEMKVNQLNWDAEKYQNQYNTLSGIAAVKNTFCCQTRSALERRRLVTF